MTSTVSESYLFRILHLDPLVCYSESYMGSPLVLSFAIRSIFAIVGLSCLLFQVLRALEWVTFIRDPDRIILVQKKLQKATVVLAIYIGVVSAIVLIEQAIPGKPLCLGLTCTWGADALVQFGII